MSAERLREAATRLREVAEAATPGGKWAVGDPRFGESDTAIRVKYAPRVTAVGHVGTKSNADYIALMAPPVALEMAAVLDNLAEANERGHLIGTFGAAGLLDTILGPTS